MRLDGGNIDCGISLSNLVDSWILGFCVVYPWGNSQCRVIYSRECNGKVS